MVNGTEKVQITKEELDRIAELAKLYLTDEECSKLREEIGAILAFADVLSLVNTDNINVMEYITENVNVFREDRIAPSFRRDIMLANAPEKYVQWFQVPKIME